MSYMFRGRANAHNRNIVLIWKIDRNFDVVKINLKKFLIGSCLKRSFKQLDQSKSDILTGYQYYRSKMNVVTII